MPSRTPHLRQWPTIQSQSQSPLFADGCLLNRNIKTDQDAASLQYDLNNLQEQEKDWQMISTLVSAKSSE